MAKQMAKWLGKGSANAEEQSGEKSLSYHPGVRCAYEAEKGIEKSPVKLITGLCLNCS